MKKRVLIYSLCLFLFFILTGCWNRKELASLSVVEAIGIDQREDGQIDLTYQILKPSVVKDQSAGNGGGGGGGGKSVWVVTTTGRTIFEAIRNATAQVDRKSFFAQNKVIVIGETTAQSGIAPLLDLYIRDPELRELVYVFIAKGQAKDIIEAEHEQEKIPGTAIEHLAEATSAVSKVPKIELIDLMKSLVSKTSAPFVPGIDLTEREDIGKKEKLVELSETAIFKKDKLVGWFNGEETRGLLWILGKVKSGIIVVKSPDDEAHKVALEIIHASSQIKPEMEDGKLTVTIEVKEEGNLGEQMSKVDLTKPDIYKELEEKQTAAIEDEIHAALNKAQEWGVDLFEFGQYYHRKFPAEWPELENNWEEEFKNIAVNVEVDAKVVREGLTYKSIGSNEGGE